MWCGVPPPGRGVGYALTGHHELLFPLLAALVVEEMEEDVMPTEIVVVVDDMRLNGYLGDSPTAQALADALPIEGQRPALGRGDLFSGAPGGGGPG